MTKAKFSAYTLIRKAVKVLKGRAPGRNPPRPSDWDIVEYIRARHDAGSLPAAWEEEVRSQLNTFNNNERSKKEHKRRNEARMAFRLYNARAKEVAEAKAAKPVKSARKAGSKAALASEG
jgi:hypothetical protein